MHDDSVHGCMYCGFRYHPEIGDPARGIPAGTRFEDLPADWTCPRCGSTHDDFLLVPRPPTA